MTAEDISRLHAALDVLEGREAELLVWETRKAPLRMWIFCPCLPTIFLMIMAKC